MVKDVDIRTLLNDELLKKYPESTIINEFTLRSGLARADIIIFDNYIRGYEIKSEADNLNRLPNQIKYYNQTAEYMTIVTCGNHLKGVLNLIPIWWQVILYKDGTFQQIREGTLNKNIDKIALISLLWKSEYIEIMKKYGIIKGWRSKKTFFIMQHIADSLTLDQIKEETIYHIRARGNWRAIWQKNRVVDNKPKHKTISGRD